MRLKVNLKLVTTFFALLSCFFHVSLSLISTSTTSESVKHTHDDMGSKHLPRGWFGDIPDESIEETVDSDNGNRSDNIDDEHRQQTSDQTESLDSSVARQDNLNETVANGKTKERENINPYEGFIRGSIYEKHFCSCKNETSHNWDQSEVTCKCFGESIVDIPDNMTKGVTRLSMISTGIEVITKKALKVYSTSLQDLYFESVKHLKWIEPGAFSNLSLLRTVYIKQAPLLKHIPPGVFHGSFPKFQVLKIIHSGLESLPLMKYFETNGIISILDFDSNRLKNITSSSVKVRAGTMILDYNDIERVSRAAFAGSHIAKLSLKGNRRLVQIDEEAFVGLKSLGKLDLSETSITKLPTKGLEEVEVIKIVDTFTLKVFPSVFNFKNLKEAQLTYSYHCCAFKFPATHDPKEFASRAYEESRHCRQGTTPMPIIPTTLGHSFQNIENSYYSHQRTKQSSHGYYQPVEMAIYTSYLTSLGQRLMRYTSKMASLISSNYIWSDSMIALPQSISFQSTTNVSENVVSTSSLPSATTKAYEYSDHVNTITTDAYIFGNVIKIPQEEKRQNASALEILQETSAKESPNPGFGFGTIEPPNFERPLEATSKQDDIIGQFHPTTASVIPEKPIQAFCGEFAQIFRNVKCSPEPDAFNPCEDVMGNYLLRIADWIISIAAVLGNLAVMVVLMSGRFTMSVSKFLMCNLAFADFCMGVYLLIIAIIDIHTIGVYFNYAIDWQHGLGCQVTGFITVFASELSIITLTVITLERWYAITYAIHLNRRLKLGLAVKTMIVGWIYAIIMASLPLFGVSGYSKTSICLPMENRDGVDIAYLTMLLTINALAFILISACYGKMYLAIVSQRSRIALSDTTVAKRMALLVFTDFACWAPIAFFGLTAVAGYPLISITNSKILLVFFYPLNSCANPFLYAILTKQYRRDFFILASRYGFCTKRAMRYKGTSTNCKHHRKVSVKIRKAAPKCGQVAYDARTERFYRYRSRNCLHQNCSSGDENSGRSVIYSAIDFYPDSSVSGDSSHEILKMGHFICDNHHHCPHHQKTKNHKKCQNHHVQIYSDDESSSSVSAKKSPMILKNGKELRRLPSAEREDILKKVVLDPSRATCSGIWTTSTSCNSIHKSHKNCAVWIQRDSSSGEKSSGGVEGAVAGNERCSCCKQCKQPSALPIENGSFANGSHSNSAADDTEI